MNYYNPYFTMMPYNTLASAPAKAGLFSNLLGGIRGIKWGSIINNTQRTLGLINQAIPVVKQVTPVVKNAKTMFQVMNEFKKVDEPVQTNNYSDTNTKTTPTVQNSVSSNNYTPIENTKNINTNEPTFFI